jgi:CHAT domain-containing protein
VLTTRTISAGSVIATLWPIEDDGATAFAQAFYAGARHRPPAEALAEARRALMSHDLYSHPFYWAGYRITSGNASSAAQNSTAVSVSR